MSNGRVIDVFHQGRRRSGGEIIDVYAEEPTAPPPVGEKQDSVVLKKAALVVGGFLVSGACVYGVVRGTGELALWTAKTIKVQEGTRAALRDALSKNPSVGTNVTVEAYGVTWKGEARRGVLVSSFKEGSKPVGGTCVEAVFTPIKGQESSAFNRPVQESWPLGYRCDTVAPKGQ